MDTVPPMGEGAGIDATGPRLDRAGAQRRLPFPTPTDARACSSKAGGLPLPSFVGCRAADTVSYGGTPHVRPLTMDPGFRRDDEESGKGRPPNSSSRRRPGSMDTVPPTGECRGIDAARPFLDSNGPQHRRPPASYRREARPPKVGRLSLPSAAKAETAKKVSSTGVCTIVALVPLTSRACAQAAVSLARQRMR